MKEDRCRELRASGVGDGGGGDDTGEAGVEVRISAAQCATVPPPNRHRRQAGDPSAVKSSHSYE